MRDYDLIVVGGGPGGYPAALEAAALGQKTLLIEKDRLGGTCLNRGCIPTKTLLHSAELLRQMQNCQSFGLTAENVGVDISALFARKDQVTDQLREGINGLLKRAKVDLVSGQALLTAPGRVQVGQEEFCAPHVLLACGSRPAAPPIPGWDLAGVLDSDGLLAAGKNYASLTIIGGGVIGVELASVYAALGCRVTVLEALDRILANFDPEISQSLTQQLKKAGVQLAAGAQVQEIKPADGGLECRYNCKNKENSVISEAVLICTGRRPNTEDLFAPELKVQLIKGYIPVDEHFAVALPGVYAVGDAVLGGVQLAHAATAQGVNAVRHMLNLPPRYDLSVIPACVYTTPELACAGLSLSRAAELGIPVFSGKALSLANGRNLIENSGRGFVRLVFRQEDQVLAGAQLLCPRASDLICGLTDALINRLTLTQLAAAVRAHPSFGELVGEAVSDALLQAQKQV